MDHPLSITLAILPIHQPSRGGGEDQIYFSHIHKK